MVPRLVSRLSSLEMESVSRVSLCARKGMNQSVTLPAMGKQLSSVGKATSLEEGKL